MEQKINLTTGDDVISTYRNWYIEGEVFENLETDEEELAFMLFLYFWGGQDTPGLCECPNCNPNCKTFLRGQPS
jgi:hypothetical protein